MPLRYNMYVYFSVFEDAFILFKLCDKTFSFRLDPVNGGKICFWVIVKVLTFSR